ncbi:MAG: biotin--[acetyl-CoA-carboxylase] ligase [Syntrophaceae bacterium]|nr:biotin--[acetyl-CoA-carboxylase] ligase [Syntrophaceae bacterium]
MTPLNGKTFQNMPAGGRFGRPLHLFGSVESTNLAALKLAAAGAPEGTAVIAEEQTAGRGRLNRTWQSPPGCNLYLSLVLRPAVEPAAAPQLTLLAGAAVAKALNRWCPGIVGVKWPNDVLIRDRKVCGILTELRLSGGGISSVIVGIGVNVNIRREELDPAFRDAATSLLEETGTETDRTAVAAALLEELENLYDLWIREGFEAVRPHWLPYSVLTGKRIRVAFQDEVEEGTAVGLDEDGALILEEPTGARKRVLAGDATILKES